MELISQNQAGRFTLAINVIDSVDSFKVGGAHAREALVDKQLECRDAKVPCGSGGDRQLEMATIGDTPG